MGLIAKIIGSFKNNNNEPAAKIEMYKNDNANARIFNPPGIDARPLDGDFCFTEDSEDTEGGKDVLGFIDPKNQPVSEKGEHRTYARDADGVIVGVAYLKEDGTFQINLEKNLVVVAEKFSFGNETDELLTILDDFLTEFKTLVGTTMLAGNVDIAGIGSTGTNSLLIPALLPDMEAVIDSLKTKLGNIKV